MCAGINPDAPIKTKKEIRWNFDQQCHTAHNEHRRKIKWQLRHIQPQSKTSHHRYNDKDQIADKNIAITKMRAQFYSIQFTVSFKPSTNEVCALKSIVFAAYAGLPSDL